MITISKDHNLLESLRWMVPENSVGFSVDLLSEEDTFFVTEDNDAALFEGDGSGCYTGHYFLSSRGKEAKDRAKAFLQFMFDRDAVVIKGLVPVEHKAARWMSRQLGFASYGTLQHPIGEFELFILHKKDFK